VFGHHAPLRLPRALARYPSLGTGGRFGAVKLRIYDGGCGIAWEMKRGTEAPSPRLLPPHRSTPAHGSPTTARLR
jgi:hypothetical protein